MPTKVIMPALGVAQQTGTLLKWLKAEGQAVAKGEPLMEVETDKATVEIEAPASGVLASMSARAGDEVPVGNTIALILAPGENADVEPSRSDSSREPGRAAPPEPTSNVKSAPALSRSSASTGQDPAARPALAAEHAPEAPRPRLLASPAAKRIARESGIDLSTIPGTGPEGSVLAADVRRAVRTPVAVENGAEPGWMIPLSPLRRLLGERMASSKQSAPHFYLNIDIDMSAVEKYRGARKQSGAAVPSIDDCILYCAARALRRYPAINSSFGESAITVHEAIHLGMAMALDDGLVVPVIRHADRCSLLELSARARELAERAQAKKLVPRDYEDGTFTVTNLGMLGVDSFIPIINPPQCAILAIGRIAPRVVAEEGMFAIRPILTATLSADHRIVDGAVAARFLKQVKDSLERGDFAAEE